MKNIEYKIYELICCCVKSYHRWSQNTRRQHRLQWNSPVLSWSSPCSGHNSSPVLPNSTCRKCSEIRRGPPSADTDRNSPAYRLHLPLPPRSQPGSFEVLARMVPDSVWLLNLNNIVLFLDRFVWSRYLPIYCLFHCLQNVSPSHQWYIAFE